MCKSASEAFLSQNDTANPMMASDLAESTGKGSNFAFQVADAAFFSRAIPSYRHLRRPRLSGGGATDIISLSPSRPEAAGRHGRPEMRRLLRWRNEVCMPRHRSRRRRRRRRTSQKPVAAVAALAFVRIERVAEEATELQKREESMRCGLCARQDPRVAFFFIFFFFCSLCRRCHVLVILAGVSARG